jgi:hypothetical protein
MKRPDPFGIATLMGVVALVGVVIYALLYTKLFPDILLVISVILIFDVPRRIVRGFPRK